MKVQHILYEFIEAEPIWEYRLDIRDSHLLKSLEIKGVLSPFILVQQKNKFCLIDGFKRYRFFNNRTVSTIPAMLYSEENVEDAFFHGIILNETQRPLSVIEKSHVIKILHQFEKEEYRSKIYDFLGIPNKKRFIQKYLHINKLPHYSKKYFHEFQFGLRQIERILPSSISSLVMVISGIPVSTVSVTEDGLPAKSTVLTEISWERPSPKTTFSALYFSLAHSRFVI